MRSVEFELTAHAVILTEKTGAGQNKASYFTLSSDTVRGRVLLEQYRGGKMTGLLTFKFFTS